MVLAKFYDREEFRFAVALQQLTGGDNSPVVFLRLSSECWLSDNACLHTLESEYKDAHGIEGGRMLGVVPVVVANHNERAGRDSNGLERAFCGKGHRSSRTGEIARGSTCRIAVTVIA